MKCDEHGVQRTTCAGWKHHETAERSEVLRLEAELTRLREERDKLHALYNRAQDDASREAEVRVNQGFELARLREERDLQFDNVIALSNERDDLLAALRESDDLLRRLSEWDMFWVDPKTGKASVADGRYWQDQIQKARPKNRAAIAEVEGGEVKIESGTPIELLQEFRPEGPGVCDPGCGVDEETPYGCEGFGARGTPHCDCSEVEGN